MLAVHFQIRLVNGSANLKCNLHLLSHSPRALDALIRKWGIPPSRRTGTVQENRRPVRADALLERLERHPAESRNSAMPPLAKTTSSMPHRSRRLGGRAPMNSASVTSAWIARTSAPSLATDPYGNVTMSVSGR